jgi:hypothetical protein
MDIAIPKPELDTTEDISHDINRRRFIALSVASAVAAATAAYVPKYIRGLIERQPETNLQEQFYPALQNIEPRQKLDLSLPGRNIEIRNYTDFEVDPQSVMQFYQRFLDIGRVDLKITYEGIPDIKLELALKEEGSDRQITHGIFLVPEDIHPNVGLEGFPGAYSFIYQGEKIVTNIPVRNNPQNETSASEMNTHLLIELCQATLYADPTSNETEVEKAKSYLQGLWGLDLTTEHDSKIIFKELLCNSLGLAANLKLQGEDKTILENMGNTMIADFSSGRHVNFVRIPDAVFDSLPTPAVHPIQQKN